MLWTLSWGYGSSKSHGRKGGRERNADKKGLLFSLDVDLSRKDEKSRFPLGNAGVISRNENSIGLGDHVHEKWEIMINDN